MNLSLSGDTCSQYEKGWHLLDFDLKLSWVSHRHLARALTSTGLLFVEARIWWQWEPVVVTRSVRDPWDCHELGEC